MKRLLLLSVIIGPSLGFLSSSSTTTAFTQRSLNSRNSNSRSSKMALNSGSTKVIMAPPLRSIDGKQGAAPELEIVYTTETETIEKWLAKHATPQAAEGSSDNTIILGFDTETIPRANFLSYGRRPPDEKEGPATIQLSTLDSCLVIHMAHCPLLNLKALQVVLEDTCVMKAGVGIDDDALELFRSSFGFELKSRLDLSFALAGYKPNRMIGLRALLEQTSKVDLPKSKKISMSNWGVKTLTDQQLFYAARDAWAGAKVVQSLHDKHGNDAILPLIRERYERPLADMDARARKRKTAKLAWKKLKDKEDPMTKEERQDFEKINEVMRDMKPDQPIRFDLAMGDEVTSG